MQTILCSRLTILDLALNDPVEVSQLRTLPADFEQGSLQSMCPQRLTSMIPAIQT